MPRKPHHGLHELVQLLHENRRKIILRDLEGLARSDKIDIFQIDDGHQTKVGDWLSTDKRNSRTV